MWDSCYLMPCGSAVAVASLRSNNTIQTTTCWPIFRNIGIGGPVWRKPLCGSRGSLGGLCMPTFGGFWPPTCSSSLTINVVGAYRQQAILLHRQAVRSSLLQISCGSLGRSHCLSNIGTSWILLLEMPLTPMRTPLAEERLAGRALPWPR